MLRWKWIFLSQQVLLIVISRSKASIRFRLIGFKQGSLIVVRRIHVLLSRWPHRSSLAFIASLPWGWLSDLIRFSHYLLSGRLSLSKTLYSSRVWALFLDLFKRMLFGVLIGAPSYSLVKRGSWTLNAGWARTGVQGLSGFSTSVPTALMWLRSEIWCVILGTDTGISLILFL